MTEIDYVNIANLQRLYSARLILGQVFAWEKAAIRQEEMRRIHRQVDDLIERLELATRGVITEEG